MFQKRKWSLSLPIVPPTVDKVAAMLKGTKRNPAEVLWVVPPRQGMLTVELVAASASWPGKARNMPLLIATVEAMAVRRRVARPDDHRRHRAVFFISGPIIEKLKLNPGTGTAEAKPVTNALSYFVNLVGDVVGGSVPRTSTKARTAPRPTSWPWCSRKTPRKTRGRRPTPKKRASSRATAS